MKLHITTQSEEGEIFEVKTIDIEPNHYPNELRPENIQKILDDTFQKEKDYDLKVEAQRLAYEAD